MTSLFAGGIFAKIVGMALDKKSNDAVSEVDNAISPSPNPLDDETDTDFHETLPREVLKMKDITVLKRRDGKKRINVEFMSELKQQSPGDGIKVTSDKSEEFDCLSMTQIVASATEQSYSNSDEHEAYKDNTVKEKHIGGKQRSVSVQSKQDSIGSVIPVITISTTESDDEILHAKNEKGKEDNVKEKKRKENYKGEGSIDKGCKKTRGSSELKSLRRQSSVDSSSEHKMVKEKKPDEGHKFQYSL